jgi:hypothetical protein
MQIAKNRIIDQQNWSEEQIKNRAKYLIQILLENILPIGDILKTGNNYSIEKRRGGNRLSFKDLNLLGKKIIYFDDASIIAEVIDDKTVKFENKHWKLSPLTCEIETRKNRRNASGAYWGANKWKYGEKTLEQLIDESKNNLEESEDDEEVAE